MTAILEGQRVRSVSTRRLGTVDTVRRRGTVDAFALVKWDDGRTTSIGLACIEPWRALSGDPRRGVA